jgi:predicted MPP superfamily phosphohydrolase
MTLLGFVLRFRNSAGVDTITEHDRIIHEAGHVWWGWWKKAHEPSHVEDLSSGLTRNTQVIALINREDRKFYFAKCERITINADADIQSPETKFTPSYYQRQKWPAWFKLTSIDEVTKESFLKRFKLIPKSDATLYAYYDDAGHPHVVPDPRGVQPDEEEAPGNGVLHLSDLHFGRDHGFPTSASKRAPITRSTLADLLVRRYKQSGVGLVVLSGDFITAGEQSGYNAAYEFANALLAGLGLNSKHLMLVPGNHDIPLDATEQELRDYEQETPFRRFAKEFTGKADIEFLRKYRTPGGYSLFFVGLNSSRLRSAETKEYGYVGEDRYGPLLDKLKNDSASSDPTRCFITKQINFAVLHHHLLPANLVSEPEAKKPVSLTVDAGRIIQDFHQAGIHFALHGHQHTPFIAGTSRYGSGSPDTFMKPSAPLYILGAGSAGCKADRLWDEMRYNTSALYHPTRKGLRVQIDEFNPGARMRTKFDDELVVLRNGD